MIFGVLPDSATTETFLNNLSEADFHLADVSVVMRDLKTRDAIAKDAGPFKGVKPEQLTGRLAHAGLSAQETQAYGDAVTQGKVLIAMTAPKGAEQAAVEMLQDHSAVLIKVV